MQLLAEDAWRSVGEVPSLLEAFVGFDRELSIIAVRGRDGAFAAYPVVENHHRDGILRLSRHPLPGSSPELQAAAEGQSHATIMTELDHVGVLAVELFQVGDRAAGQRDGAPGAQQRPLDRRRRAGRASSRTTSAPVTGLPLGRSTQPSASAPW